MSGNSHTSDNDTSQISSPFVTTTQLMDRINYHLKDLEGNQRFELQRKFADGTTRKASASEAAAADMNSKLQQAAVLVSKLTPSERKEWANSQRELGNQLYQRKEYQEAIDVYFTSLVAAQGQEEEDDQLLFFLRVMNNLGQSAIQLKWYKKAIDFTDLALEKVGTGERFNNPEEIILMVKIYFKRGKANRLRGNYQDAHKNLKCCEEWIEKLDTSESSSASIREELTSGFAKESKLVERSLREAKKNKQRQERAMQKILGSTTSAAQPSSATSLYADKNVERQFSTLRAPKEDDEYYSYAEDDDNTPTCWRAYLGMAGRVAKAILIWMGDEEFVDAERKRKYS